MNSIRRLTTIARALGPERTRSELVPFLADANDEEDECLLAVAEEMVNLLGSVGGTEHAHALLTPWRTSRLWRRRRCATSVAEFGVQVARDMTPEGARCTAFDRRSPRAIARATGSPRASPREEATLLQIDVPQVHSCARGTMRRAHEI